VPEDQEVVEPNELPVQPIKRPTDTSQPSTPGLPAIPPQSAAKISVKDDPQPDLAWTILGGLVMPFGFSLIFRGLMGGWNSGVVDTANLSFCLLALALAILVRMLTTRVGTKFLPWVVALFAAQVVLALALSGTFDRSRVDPAELERGLSVLQTQLTHGGGQNAEAANSAQLEQMLTEQQQDDLRNSWTLDIILAASGALTLAFLIRLWSPRASGEARDSDG
jgi:hypothetical protein